MADKLGVFISYAHQDVEGVRKIHARLTKAGLKPWIDELVILDASDPEEVPSIGAAASRRGACWSLCPH